jgi:phosphoserine phosphatase RsbU/P
VIKNKSTKRTILRQLMVNILVPVLLLFSVVFISVYNYQHSNLEETIRQRKKNIVAETKNLIAYYDFAMRNHEKTMVAYMH